MAVDVVINSTDQADREKFILKSIYDLVKWLDGNGYKAFSCELHTQKEDGTYVDFNIIAR